MTDISRPTYSRRSRVLALRDAAIHLLGVEPGIEWLHREHPALLGLPPSGAAWASARLAQVAFDLLLEGRPLVRTWERYLRDRQILRLLK